jgi:hypothetical protein
MNQISKIIEGVLLKTGPEINPKILAVAALEAASPKYHSAALARASVVYDENYGAMGHIPLADAISAYLAVLKDNESKVQGPK